MTEPETSAEAPKPKPKRRFQKKNVTVQDADITVGKEFPGKVVRESHARRCAERKNATVRGARETSRVHEKGAASFDSIRYSRVLNHGASTHIPSHPSSSSAFVLFFPSCLFPLFFFPDCLCCVGRLFVARVLPWLWFGATMKSNVFFFFFLRA